MKVESTACGCSRGRVSLALPVRAGVAIVRAEEYCDYALLLERACTHAGWEVEGSHHHTHRRGPRCRVAVDIGNPQNLHLINLKLKFEKLEDSSEIDESGKI